MQALLQGNHRFTYLTYLLITYSFSNLNDTIRKNNALERMPKKAAVAYFNEMS